MEENDQALSFPLNEVKTLVVDRVDFGGITGFYPSRMLIKASQCSFTNISKLA